MRTQPETPGRPPERPPKAAEPLPAVPGTPGSAPPIRLRPPTARARARDAGGREERPPYAEFLDGLHAARMRGVSED